MNSVERNITAYTISSPLHSPKGLKRSISIDLDLKGALEFNASKNFITVPDKKLTGYNEISRSDSRSPRVETFTGFIREVIKVLYTYDDNTFEDFCHILVKEIRNYYYTGSKFHEFTEDYEIRNLLANKFDFIKAKSVRDVIEKIKDKVNYKNVKRLLSYINSIYKEDAREEFREVLTDLMAYRSSNNTEPNYDLAKIIRNGVWAVFFNHYTNLDAKEKRGLKQEIIVFLNGLTENPSASSKEIIKKSDPTSTTVQNKEENKRRQIPIQQSSDELSANEENILSTTTSEEESDSQKLVLTFVSTEETYHESTEGRSRVTSPDDLLDKTGYKSSLGMSQEPLRKLNVQPYETLHIEDFYKTTEKPQININKSEMKNKLAKGRSIEISTDRLPTVRPNTKRLRHITTAHPASKRTINVVFRRFLRVDDNDNLHDKDTKSSIAPPMSKEELSDEAFDRERKDIEEDLAKSYSFVNKKSIRHGLKNYINKRKRVDKKINELIQECNQFSRTKVTTYKGDKVNTAMNDYEAKNKIHNNTNNRTEDKNIKETKAFSERQSSKNKKKIQSGKRKETSDKKRKLKKKKKVKKSWSKKTSKKVQTTSTRDKYSTGTMKTPSIPFTSIFESVKTPVFLELPQTAKEKNNLTNLYKKEEAVKSLDKKLIKLRKKKKVKRSRSKKAKKKAQTTDTRTRDKHSTEVMKTSKIKTSILESVKKKNLTETTSEATTEVYNATLNVNKEIIVNNNVTAVNFEDETRRKLKLYIMSPTPSTVRQRRVLPYSSPPF